MMSLNGDYAKKFKIFTSQDDIAPSMGFDKLQEEERYQRLVKKRHSRNKRSLIGLGKQKNTVPFSVTPSFKRGKSAPVGSGGS